MLTDSEFLSVTKNARFSLFFFPLSYHIFTRMWQLSSKQKKKTITWGFKFYFSLSSPGFGHSEKQNMWHQLKISFNFHTIFR